MPGKKTRFAVDAGAQVQIIEPKGFTGSCHLAVPTAEGYFFVLPVQEKTLICLKYLSISVRKPDDILIEGGVLMRQNGEGQMLYSFTRLADVQEKGAKVIVKGEDCYVWDAEGKKYIDGFSGLQVVNVGHGRKEIADAVYRQMLELEYWHSFFGFTTKPTIQLVEKLASLAPGSLNVTHFVNSGSEGNDSAFKIVRAYFKSKGQGGRYKIIYRDKAYHGMNMGATSANGFAGNRTPYEPLVPGFIRIPNAHCYRCPMGKEYPSCKIECAYALEKAILEEGPESVAAFIADPVQGTIGGYVPAVQEYFPIIREICDKYGILFICDEVITGFGRTGKMFGIEHYPGVQPDIMVVAKGLSSGYVPLGAVIVSDEIAAALAEGLFYHGYTYGGHPVATACALINIDIIEREKLAEKAADTGDYIANALESWLELPFVGEVRAKGMMFGIELVKDKETREPFTVGFAARVLELALEKGLVMRMSTGGYALLLCPPLTMSKDIADQMLGILKETLMEVGQELFWV
jgi:putrescine---pyruvate transaminase